MLLRQARQSLSLHHRAGVFQLYKPATRFPPSHASVSALHRRNVITSDSRPRPRRLSDASQRHGSERTLATAVGDLYLDGTPYNQFGVPGIPPFQAHPLRSYQLDVIDPTKPLVIPESDGAKPLGKMNKHGAPSDIDDLFSVFDACLRVGKLERAALVLKRLNIAPMLSGEERIILNNQYLRSSLNQMRTAPDQDQAEKLHMWYEMQIRSKGLPHTAETIACMLKASLLSQRGARLRRLVTRYMGLAPGEAGLRVLSMADILSDQDLAVITDICPTYNFAADPEGFEEMVDEYGEADLSSAESKKDMAEKAAFPDLVPTPQRGEGLSSLKKSLEFLSGLQEVDISKLPLADQREVQVRLERDSISSAIMKWRIETDNLSKMGRSTSVSSGAGKEGSLPQHLGWWLDAMETRLKHELTLVEMSEKKEIKSEVDLERCIYGPFISQGDPTRLAAITILSAINMGAIIGADKGIVISSLVNHVAKHAQEDIVQFQKERRKRSGRKRKVQFDSSVKPARKPKAEAQAKPGRATRVRPPRIIPNEIIEIDQESEDRLEESFRQPWSTVVKSQVGAILVKALIESAKIKVTVNHPVKNEPTSQFQPAFSQAQQIRKGRKVGVLKMNPNLVDKLKREPVGDFLAKHLPMVVEPKPWRRFSDGGFLEGKTNLIRIKSGDVEQRMYTNAAIKAGDLKQLFKGLDVLGKTAWRINRPVFEVMMEAWNSGKEVANLPPLEPQFEAPPEPDEMLDPAEHRAWTRKIQLIENERSGLHSQRCFMNLQLEIARAFRNQTIYFPHNVDYRGRAYPIPTYLNHMGADHTRGLLTFSKGRELGARGLRWLKIHLANVFGLDKASFDDREAFAMENVENIRDSTNNPLGGQRWWLKAEDPWQCLAACYELKAALELPDPTKYVSHLPIQQDGTCNGLQHYAALGGDSWGARQVNLEPGEKPADVYSAVADLVKESIAKDIAEKNPMAMALDGKITRKVVKQTVMTNVYGVTFQGAKKQVCKQIDALYPTLGADNGTNNIMLATYIARLIFKALATMFRGAHDIQYWLGDVGGRVCRALTRSQIQQVADTYNAEQAKVGVKKTKSKSSASSHANMMSELQKSFRSTVVWTTPLRLPVVQPYRKSTQREVRTCLQSIVYPVNDQTDPVNRRKQLQGFPPNFIHSLDASHMLLSALQCDTMGLSFAAVHDSFWTHAADVDTMNSVLRESFIQIHEEDVVGRLAAEFKARHEGSLFLANIDPDTPVAKKIKELRSNSKLSAIEELLLEHKRNTLRLSGNPWDLEAAKQIVTPASVYEDMVAAEEDVLIDEGVQEMALGSIPDEDVAAMDAAQETASETQESSDILGESVDDIADLEASAEEDDLPKPRTTTTGKKGVPVGVWLPMSIPAIPKKGDFNVTRLRESKYFFS